MANFTIRETMPDDFDAILALWFSIDRHTALPDKPEYLQQFLDFSPDLFLVAEVDERIVGTIIGGWDGWRGHIARLATDPKLRRAGIAQALVRRSRHGSERRARTVSTRWLTGGASSRRRSGRPRATSRTTISCSTRETWIEDSAQTYSR